MLLNFWYDNQHHVGYTVETARKHGIPEQVVLGALRVALKDHAIQRRVILAASGITVAGVKVSTDPESLALLHSAMVLNKPVNWHTDKGTFVPITPDQIKEMATEAAAFVQKSFDRLRDVFASIDAGKVQTEAEVNTALV